MLEDTNPDAACMYSYLVRNIYTKKENKLRKVPQQIIFSSAINYRLRRAERWKNMPRVSSELSEIKVIVICIYTKRVTEHVHS